ncbi:hypothetical protein [Vitiosangium sp. GDMCC 1.1324]|uniref:hypothetical protein n=1 Tax=Vitiosangium sp. (strain GDMCC 1.1324) TaxID=2138576 RepID=UPI000D3AAC04|nr:hypothetical protein [Vitiosangium sp. GDMCC 1.1324]PTL80111.1 hypothetical protein DAT35_29245 [Vitiosangium sp. GDMCC 1.1324]
MSQEAVPVDPHETLYLPMRRRFMSEYATTPEGTRELRLHFGVKEITFDEPELFSFGETLIKQDQFMAGSATTWSSGEPYSWERVRELIEALLAEDILSREPPKPPAGSDQHWRFLESEARRQAPTEPLWWNPDCPKVMERLTGRPLELGFLESVLPLHRVAHPALDAEGRHVGEMNVFPDAMRMNLPTDWRSCPYPGSRYRDDAMMNVTALRSMTRHWKPVLQGVLAVREEFLRRYPLLPDGRWRVGDVHAVSCLVLALPTLLLMRGNEPVPNGALDPVLSSMFRVTDGVRMVMSNMLLVPELGATYDSPMTAAELHRITEQTNLFLSTRGVCAGPPHLVDEFLATLLDGKPMAGAPAPMAGWGAEIPAAVDYGLLGLQLYVLQFNLWSYMGPAYEAIRGALLEVEDEPDGVLGRLRAHVERDWELILSNRLHESDRRDWIEARRAEVYECAQRGLRGFREDALHHLRDAFTPARDEVDAKARLRLRELIRSRAGSPSGAQRDALDTVADAVAEFLAIERSALRALETVQRQVNALLQRPHPDRRFTGADLAIHHDLRVGLIRVLPYLMDVLRDELGITVENTADMTRIEITNA